MVGRRTLYKKEYCDEIVKYFSVQPQSCMYKREYYKDGTLKSETPILTPAEFPTFQGFASKIGVHVDTLHEWKDKHPEFSEAYTCAKQIQENIWLVNSMGNLYNAQFAKFFGINCLGYKEKIETTSQNTNKNYDLSAISTEELRAMLREESK